LELLTIAVIGVLIFGPDKLPKVIQDISNVIRKVRQFSESAKQDIRTELGPEFKDFEFEDLNPKTFLRKQLDSEGLGLDEIRNGFDFRKDMADITESVNGREIETSGGSSAGGTGSAGGAGTSGTTGSNGSPNSGPDLLKKRDKLDPDERPPYDSDAT
jgi:sec-independent protein translocase protein TatB